MPCLGGMRPSMHIYWRLDAIGYTLYVDILGAFPVEAKAEQVGSSSILSLGI